ncbi:MAG: ribonuclease HII [bacterium]
MLRHERQAWLSGHNRLAGIDEAGRGPLAGPVIAAAVLIDRTFLEAESEKLFSGLTDSKQLTAARRDHFFSILTDHASVRMGIGRAEVDEIDAINILKATHAAMARALAQLMPEVDHALVDGLSVHGLPCSSTAIVKGDAASLLIAAASIVAKVTRDRIMLELDRDHPVYGFAKHKGYGTVEHLEAIRAHGPCVCHRRSFKPVRELWLDL